MSLTTDPNDKRLNKKKDESLSINSSGQLFEKDPQDQAYLVLSEEELAKGYVRPFRDSYIHVGRKVCGKENNYIGTLHLGDKVAWVCCQEEHNGDCHGWKGVTKEELDRIKKTGYLGGCDGLTKMNETISRTYAANPKFYGRTFCVHCQEHIDVDEFLWDGTNEKVGS